MKILHLITSLGSGGAEKVLYDIATSLNNTQFEHVIVSIKDLGFYGKNLKDNNIRVYTLNVSKLSPWKLFKLTSILKNEKPDIIQSWLYHADFLTIIPYVLGYKNIVWNIRNNKLPWLSSSKLTIFLRKLCAYLSFIPREIICCANSAKTEHIKIGYRSNKFTVINNGYDFTKFKHNLEICKRVRQELGIEDDELIIGNVGRFDPAKDHKTLLMALQIAKQANIKFRILLIGKNISWENRNLSDLIELTNLDKHVILLDQQPDVFKYFNAMNIFVLSSESEAFPNVLAEAMASHLPCITTDAGDAREILNNDQHVVPIKDYVQLAEKIINLLSKSQDELNIIGNELRQRIISNYSLSVMIKKYEEVYLRVSR